MPRFADDLHAEAPQHIDPASRPQIDRLTGPRLVLRPLEETDLLQLSQIMSKPGVAEWWPMHSAEVLRADLIDAEGVTPLAIEYNGDVIGLISYEEELWREYFSASIDIALDSDLRGEGLGPEALRLLVAWLIDVGGHHRITLDPAAANTSAIRAYEKLGFKPVGVMREYELGPDGHWRDGLLMDLLAREFDRGDL